MDWKLVGGLGLVGLGLVGLNSQSKRAESFEATQWWNRQSATGHERPSGDYGGFFIQTNYDKETIKEIFKDWKPKAYPYEKRITQDSFNNWCENCGEIHDEEKLIHYQFYLPQSNSRRNRMRYVSGNYCGNDASCGADICEDCYGDESCEECGVILCNNCKEDSEYAEGETLCQECMPEEYQAESFSAEATELYRTDPKELLELARKEGLECMYCEGSSFHDPYAMPYSKAVGGATIYYPCDCGETQVVITGRKWGAEEDGNYSRIELLAWVEDYLWDNDKKGYQAYYNKLKSLGLSAENHAYTYAYNEGHSDARKTGKYHPTLVEDRDKADFKRVLKQKE